MRTLRAFTNSLMGLALAAAAGAASAATMQVINLNGAGVGFNDPTAAAPVGGNTGTTVGQQRLIAFQFAADKWGAILKSSQVIKIGAQFSSLSCGPTSGVLGSAGPNTAHWNFTNAPVANTAYVQALANSLANADLSVAQNDINANFNSDLGTASCLTNLGWYYGLDSNPGANKIDFVSVLLHEMGHGLGFLSLVNLSTGAKFNGIDDTYMRNLEHHGAAVPGYPAMSDAQRVAASISGTNLHWIGANVKAASGVLTVGRDGDHVQMFAPNPAQSGSSVSHWNQTLTPIQLMRPSYTAPTPTPILELPLFKDLGWQFNTTGRVRDDFGADGKSDIFWQNVASGETVLWQMNGVPIGAANLSTPVPDLNWKIIGTGDFNGDGKADLLWQHQVLGTVVIWLMNGPAIATPGVPATVADLNWKIIGIGDFNGDGKSDILWRYNPTGDLYAWFMNGTGIGSSAPLPTVPAIWAVNGIGDFNADNKQDILWRHTVTGEMYIWMMNGAAIGSAGSPGTVGDLAWQIHGVADYNADGKTDILWRNMASGDVYLWFMNGAAIGSSGLVFAGLDGNWQVQGVGDYNGDGKADILFKHMGNGQLYTWLMNGTAIAGGGSPYPAGVADLNWRIIKTP